MTFAIYTIVPLALLALGMVVSAKVSSRLAMRAARTY